MTTAGNGRRRRLLRDALDTAASASLVVIGAIFAWSAVRGAPIIIAPPPAGVAQGARAAGRTPAEARNREAPLPAQPISLAGAATRGSKNAPIAVIEFSDFQCPYCGRFARETLPKLTSGYVAEGKVLIAFRNLPLETVHPFAESAAAAAECAARQGRFWPMHDLLFVNQQDLSSDSIFKYATSLGLEGVPFKICLAAAETRDEVRADAAGASALGVTGTPTFFVGRLQRDGRVKVTARLLGAAPLERFQSEFEKIAGAPPAHN